MVFEHWVFAQADQLLLVVGARKYYSVITAWIESAMVVADVAKQPVLYWLLALVHYLQILEVNLRMLASEFDLSLNLVHDLQSMRVEAGVAQPASEQLT